LRKRREGRIRAAGDDAFGRYTMGKMLLNLKQMSGRLIRTEDDRGLVVIVEGRTDKSYFRRLGEAFPAASTVEVIRPSDLSGLVAQVGIEPRERAILPHRNGRSIHGS
jgi:Rad3-related DNA helicase